MDESIKLLMERIHVVKEIRSWIKAKGHTATISNPHPECEINAIINDKKFLIDVMEAHCFDVENIAKQSNAKYMLVNSLDEFIKQLLISLVIDKT